jgi:hypothetical protein
LVVIAQSDSNSGAPEHVPYTGTEPSQQRGVQVSASGESGPSAASTPRDSEASARTCTTSRSARDTSFRLEPGTIVCFVAADGSLMGVRQSSAVSRELSLVPVTSASSLQAGHSKRIQHYPADSMFVVGKQVMFLRIFVPFPCLSRAEIMMYFVCRVVPSLLPVLARQVNLYR